MVDERRETGRLLLRPLELADLHAVFQIESDPATNENRPGGAPTQSELADYLRTVVSDWETREVGYWAVEHDGALIGVCGLRPMELQGVPCWNLYYRFSPVAWGRGLAAEAAREALAFAEEQRPRLPVVARTRPANEPAKKVALRAGLARREDLDADGFEVFAADW